MRDYQTVAEEILVDLLEHAQETGTNPINLWGEYREQYLTNGLPIKDGETRDRREDAIIIPIVDKLLDQECKGRKWVGGHEPWQ